MLSIKSLIFFLQNGNIGRLYCAPTYLFSITAEENVGWSRAEMPFAILFKENAKKNTRSWLVSLSMIYICFEVSFLLGLRA